jgi:hypothetical protein
MKKETDMPLYAVTIEEVVETRMRVRIEASHEDAAEEFATRDYDHGPERRLTWLLVGEDGNSDTSVELVADDAPPDPPYVSWDEQYGHPPRPSAEASCAAGPTDVRKVVIFVNGGLVESVCADGPIDAEIFDLNTVNKDEREKARLAEAIVGLKQV